MQLSKKKNLQNMIPWKQNYPLKQTCYCRIICPTKYFPYKIATKTKWLRKHHVLKLLGLPKFPGYVNNKKAKTIWEI